MEPQHPILQALEMLSINEAALFSNQAHPDWSRLLAHYLVTLSYQQPNHRDEGDLSTPERLLNQVN